MMQVRKHKEQAEWAGKKYAELERYSACSMQHVDTVLQCSLCLLCIPTPCCHVRSRLSNHDVAQAPACELVQQLQRSAHSLCECWCMFFIQCVLTQHCVMLYAATDTMCYMQILT